MTFGEMTLAAMFIIDFFGEKIDVRDLLEVIAII